ncbi:MAG: hypothetical protein CVU05_10685 [Bacteroidetes bacterium HGW-Bacteroidetes-21]|nr:MAG: hypothetical protein CVU05_10685 [Bacteroidetes bacterium HGW-Bacteroidetes-21]
MTNFRKISIPWLLTGIFLGGTGGFLYYYYVGCQSGTCPITSNPWITVLYGTLIGGILFYKKKKEIKEPTETEE